MDSNNQNSQGASGQNSSPGTLCTLNQQSPQGVLWSRYKHIQELITGPILPLVVLIGPLTCTTWVQKIIRDSMKSYRQQNAQGQSLQELQETSKFNIRIKCYEFYNTYRSPSNPDGQLEMPPFYKEQQHGYHSGLFKKTSAHELGHIKLRFFDSISVYKPAVTVMIFDWQTQNANTFDWARCESKILDEYRSFQEKCPITAKDTRIILLIMLPLNGDIPVDKYGTSLKNALRLFQQGEDGQQGNPVKQVLMMPKGIEGLRSNPKDFTKKVIEQCGQFYASKKRDIKAKQRKLINKDSSEHVRYFFKVGIYSQLSKGDLLASMKHIKQAYDDLRAQTTTGTIASRQVIEERRENADIIMMQLLVYLIDQRNYDGFIKQFQAHLHAYKSQFDEITAKAQSTNAYTYYLSKLDEHRWRANWHVTIAKMLEQKPVLFNDNQNIYQIVNKQGNQKGRQGNLGMQSPWLTDTQLESLFSGYHHLNCMLALLRRRQEIKRMFETFRIQKGSSKTNDGKDIYSKLREDVNDTILSDISKMLGREFTVSKNMNHPLAEQAKQTSDGGLGLNMQQTQIMLDKHKLLMIIECLDDLNLQILRSGQIALSSYKAKNQLMAQHDVENATNNYKFMKAHCHRMIQFIHFHLAAHIFDLKDDQNKILKGETDLAKVCKQANFIVDEHLLREGQKYRDQVATSLMVDGWNSEATSFIEDYRSFQELISKEQKSPDEMFQYEMQILNVSKTLTRDQRCERFLNLINMDFSSYPKEKGPIVSSLNGANLIWARARFDKEMDQEVQVNQWVKLTIEVYTRLKEQINVATLKACFNDDGFDYEREGTTIQRDSPLVIEQEIYLDETKVYKHLRSKDKLLALILENVIIKVRDKPILFCLQPYLTAKDIILPKLEKKGAGLKLPVALNIKDMPPMLQFKFVNANTVQETLIGNRHQFKVAITRTKNVNLKSLKLQFENITYSGTDLQGNPDDAMMNQLDRINDFRDPQFQQRRTAIQGMQAKRNELNSNHQHGSVMQVTRKHGKGKQGTASKQAAANTSQQNTNAPSDATYSGVSDEQLLNAPGIGKGQGKEEEGKVQANQTESDERQTMGMFDPSSGDKFQNQNGLEDDPSKDFQIAYRYNKASRSSSHAACKDLDYPNQTVVEFPSDIISGIKENEASTAGKAATIIENDDNTELSIYFTFFEPSMNFASLKFTYSFTQTYEDSGDLLGMKQARESVEFTQDFSHILKIKSIQPFEVQWGLVRSADPFLRINDPLPNNPQQQPFAQQQELKSALDQKFKVWCKIRNVSSQMPLKITQSALILVLGQGDQSNPECQQQNYSRRIGLLAQEKEPLVSFQDDKPKHQKIEPKEQIQFMSESITISSTEIEQIFKSQESGIAALGHDSFKQGLIGGFEGPSGRQGAVTAGALQIDDFMKVKKQKINYNTNYIVQNPFKLELSWSEASEKAECLWDLRDQSKQEEDKPEVIESSMSSPQHLNLIKVPIKVELYGEIVSKSQGSNVSVPVTTLKLEKPVKVVYRISNLCDNHIFECVALLDVQSKHFYASGDVRTRFEIMPLDFVDLEFQLLPLQLGLHNLPKLHIIDKTVNHDAMQLQGKNLNDADFMQQQKDKNQPMGYLIKGFTRRILIQN